MIDFYRKKVYKVKYTKIQNTVLNNNYKKLDVMKHVYCILWLRYIDIKLKITLISRIINDLIIFLLQKNDPVMVYLICKIRTKI